MAVIEPKLLKNLSKYKYSGVDKSLLSKYLLQPYWNWLVTLFPMWSKFTTDLTVLIRHYYERFFYIFKPFLTQLVAPNLITLIGFLCIVFNFCTIMYYSPDLLNPAPSWVYYSCAFGLFFYQSMDAIDGKQARRTGTSSPLGQLFDHGCDALNAGLGGIIAFSALNLGGTWIAVVSFIVCTLSFPVAYGLISFSGRFLWMVALANFYLSTWEEFHTGTLYLGYFNGPVEGVVTLVGVYLISAIYGPMWWNKSYKEAIPALNQFSALPDLPTNVLFSYFCLAIVVTILISSLMNVREAKKKSKNKSDTFQSAVMGLLPFIVLMGSLCAWFYAFPILLKNHFPTVLLVYCIAFSNIVGQIIVAHTVHDDFPISYAVNIPTFLGAVFAITAKYIASGPSQYAVYENHMVFLLYVSLTAVSGIHGRFVHGVIAEICDYLKIKCFTIPSPPKKSK